MDEINKALTRGVADYTSNPKRTILTCWKPSLEDWITLNTDGSVKSTAFGGDLLRDHNGNWIKGFLVKIDRCSAVEAELWAVLHGLKMAWDNGHREICRKFPKNNKEIKK